MMELKDFLEKVAADTPTPGGGSVSALAGALSASLVAMVAGLSFEKGKGNRARFNEIRKNALSIQRKLLWAIEEDSKSFEAVLSAFRLPKNSERERQYRTKKIQKAYRDATLIPQLVCQQSLRLLDYSKMLILRGNPNAMSDAGVAAFLADAALAGGLLNIGINLVSVTDQTFTKKMNASMQKWAKKRNDLMKTILMKLVGINEGEKGRRGQKAI